MNSYDVMVMGSGFAGMAASLFAARRGLRVAQAGAIGGIDFSTGFIDLLAVHPLAEGRVWQNPWEALTALRRDLPNHPYARLTDQEIEEALAEFTFFLGEQGLCYTGTPGQNTRALTAAGTLKPTYLLPCSAWNGVVARERKAPTLLIDFHGLKGFSARQIVEMQRPCWPDLKAQRIQFPGLGGELYPDHMAWALAEAHRREELAALVAPFIDDVEFVGFPAIMGIANPKDILTHLQALLGRQCFEVPTLPPSIAGPRLRAAFDRGLPGLGVRTFTQKTVNKAVVTEHGFRFTAGVHGAEVTIEAKSAVLASGRFFGKGLKAERGHVREAVFDLPVTQPENRTDWHRESFFDPQGHAINQAGLETDAIFRPLGADGQCFHPRLHSAGAILAHQDWMRQKCGAGLAITTAYKSVKELIKGL